MQRVGIINPDFAITNSASATGRGRLFKTLCSLVEKYDLQRVLNTSAEVNPGFPSALLSANLTRRYRRSIEKSGIKRTYHFLLCLSPGIYALQGMTCGAGIFA